MAKLVIVESLAKAKTIKEYLGDGYEVEASIGHVRDLPKTLLGVDIEHNFKPRYVDIAGKTGLIRKLKALAAASDGVLLATDPDREGEAISWHLAQILGVDITGPNRVTFNEITRTGVQQGMAHPRALDMDLVNAQQARRILDRIVGYQISPFLWKKVRNGLSAGRVQSAAVRVVVDREEEIRRFVRKEFWNIDARLSAGKDRKTFSARLYGNKKGKLTLDNQKQADAVMTDLKNAAFVVETVKKGTRQIVPAPPFTTSTLQQESNRKLGFPARRTMMAAQELYEGVTVPGVGAIGLITYMRTDSLRISEDARRDGTVLIRDLFGEQYLPEKPRYYKTKKSAQDAHEAIRPTVPALTPDKVRSSLTDDQYKLYKLIWDRFIASLMAVCRQETCQVTIRAGEQYQFRASGYRVASDGFTKLYVESRDEEDGEDGTAPLPMLTEGMVLTAREICPSQHFTQPPARYTEATLIKAMEENGFGRPSTYAPTVGIILSREYIERDGKSLKPTPLGEVTTGLMKDYFPEIVDVEFTAHMEEQLDSVEGGKSEWGSVLSDFYKGFEQTLKHAEETLTDERVQVPVVESGEVCELCGKPMLVKSGRYGKFLACAGYPECKNTRRIMVKTAGVCPKCGGTIVAQRSKRNRKFYGCSNYPKCDFVTWDEPSGETCPQCGKTLFKKQGRTGSLYCPDEQCGFTKQKESKKKAADHAAE